MMPNEAVIFSEKDIACAVSVLAKSIFSAHSDLSKVVLVGILSRGFPLAERVSHYLFDLSGHRVPVGKLDVALYRDDLLTRDEFVTVRSSDLQFDISEKTVILVDDVLFKGRTVRAALNGIADFGRPKRIELAVLIDRNCVEMPVFARHVGYQIQNKESDYVRVKLFEIDGVDEILLKPAIE
jgi:pyrimidine operon attenuation protein/uracil phosphoribosyltransferase